jgi:hypothetical protein
LRSVAEVGLAAPLLLGCTNVLAALATIGAVQAVTSSYPIGPRATAQLVVTITTTDHITTASSADDVSSTQSEDAV